MSNEPLKSVKTPEIVSHFINGRSVPDSGRTQDVFISARNMKTALAAGMVPIGALWGFRSREELIGSGAKTVIEHPSQLLKLLFE